MLVLTTKQAKMVARKMAKMDLSKEALALANAIKAMRDERRLTEEQLPRCVKKASPLQGQRMN